MLENSRFVRANLASHAELSSPDFHGPSNHQPVSRLEDVQGASDVGEADCANEDRDLGTRVRLLEVAGHSMSGLGWNCRKT